MGHRWGRTLTKCVTMTLTRHPVTFRQTRAALRRPHQGGVSHSRADDARRPDSGSALWASSETTQVVQSSAYAAYG
jgi:hypothetical protein